MQLTGLPLEYYVLMVTGLYLLVIAWLSSEPHVINTVFKSIQVVLGVMCLYAACLIQMGVQFGGKS